MFDHAPVAQWIRVSGFYPFGRRFESYRGYQRILPKKSLFKRAFSIVLMAIGWYIEGGRKRLVECFHKEDSQLSGDIPMADCLYEHSPPAMRNAYEGFRPRKNISQLVHNTGARVTHTYPGPRHPKRKQAKKNDHEIMVVFHGANDGGRTHDLRSHNPAL